MKKILAIFLLCSIVVSNIGFAATDRGFLPAVYAILFAVDSKYEPINELFSPILPRDDSFRPLEKKRFVPFTQQVEYMMIGQGYKSDGANTLFVIDPLEYNFDPNNPGVPVNPGGADDVMDKKNEPSFDNQYKKISASGVMDDDVQDEVAVVSWPATGPGMLSIIDPAGEPDATTFTVETVSLSLDIEGQQDLLYDYDIALGDVDGDGYDEIVVAGSIGGITPGERLGKLWIVDDARAGNGLITSRIIQGHLDAGSESMGVDQLKVAVGNIDQDWAEEIAVAYAAVSQLPFDYSDGPIYYRVYDDAVRNFSILVNEGTSVAKIKKGMAGWDTTGYSPYVVTPSLWNYYNIAIGDMDRDGRDEIALGIRSCSRRDNNYERWWAVEGFFVDVFDDALGMDGYAPGEEDDGGDGFAALKSADGSREYYYEPGGGKAWTDVDYFKFFDMVDIDGDNADEIFTGSALLDDLASVNPLGKLLDEVGDRVEPWAWEYPVTVNSEKIQSVSYGDINGDLREDITILYSDSIIQSIGFKDEGGVRKWFGGRTVPLGGPDDYLDQRGSETPLLGKTIIASANVDSDSTIVEYQGDNPANSPADVSASHSTFYDRNQIIAVLAAPPAIDGINAENSCTSFGLHSTHSVGTGAEFSSRSGVLVGVEVEVSVGFFVSSVAFSFETEMKAEIETTQSVNTSYSVTKTAIYNTCGLEDLVVFSTTPFDRYLYTINSHPDTNLIGRVISIDVPQKPKMYSWTRSYYNNHNGNQMDIGDEILQHTPGNIATYPNRTKKDSILSQTVPALLINDGQWWFESEVTKLSEYSAVTVQQGSGSSGVELDLIRESGFEQGITGSLDFMSKACAGGVCGGVTGGFSIGASRSYTMAEGITFSADVAAIPGNLWETNNYEYGIFGYQQTLTDDETKKTHEFVVVNYWVE